MRHFYASGDVKILFYKDDVEIEEIEDGDDGDGDDEVGMDDVAFEYEEEEGGNAARRRENARDSVDIGKGEGDVEIEVGQSDVAIEDVAFEFEEEENKSSSQRKNRTLNKKAMPIKLTFVVRVTNFQF